jgi:hypothetical protein
LNRKRHGAVLNIEYIERKGYRVNQPQQQQQQGERMNDLFFFGTMVDGLEALTFRTGDG